MYLWTMKCQCYIVNRYICFCESWNKTNTNTNTFILKGPCPYLCHDVSFQSLALSIIISIASALGLSTLWWLLFSHQVLIHSKVYIVSIWILPLQGCTTSRPPELINYFRPGARFLDLQCKNLLEHLCPAQRCFDMNLKWGQGPYYFKSHMN